MAKFCGNCGNEVDANAYICVKCGAVVEHNEKSNNIVNVDKGGFGWGVLGFFVPIVGLILYLVWKNDKPNSAKASGMGALISVILGIVLYSIVMIILGLMFSGFILEL